MRKFITIATALGFLSATGIAPVLAASTDISSQAAADANGDMTKPAPKKAKKKSRKHKRTAKKHKTSKKKSKSMKKAAPKQTGAIVYRIAA